MTALRPRRPSVRVYLTAAVTVAVALGMVAVTVVAYRIQDGITRERFADTVRPGVLSVADRLESLAAHGAPTSVIAQTASRTEQNYAVSFAVFPIGRPSDDSLCRPAACYPVPVSARQAVTAGHSFSGFGRGGELPVFVAAVPLDGTELELVATFDISQQLVDLRALRNDLVRLDAVGLALALVAGIAVALTVSRPVRRAAAAARRFSDGELEVRLPVRGGAEVAELATSFNAMAEGLATTLRDLNRSQSLQRRFVADVSHELRTPLAAMVAASGAMDSADPAAREQASSVLRSQTSRLHRLVEDLLEISRLDAGQAAVEPEPVDLVELCRDVVATIAPGADITVTSTGDTEAAVDVRRVHTVLRNLVSNAVRHGVPPVDVAVDGDDGQVVRVLVSDHGAGVPEDLVATVFDRFVRGDRARGSDGTSTGLGLAIAAENARLHGGSLELIQDGRVSFVLGLPRIPR